MSRGTIRQMPRGIVALGVVSLLMDMSSEMVHSLLPVFLVSVLGAGAISVGLIEGIAEATASITKVFSGTISDWLGRRRPLVLLGYGLAAVTKPVFAVANAVPIVLGARFVDRVGKGIRGAPRDALIADIASPDQRGAAFGLRQSMDTIGAFAGPALAIALMAVSDDDFRLVFWLAVIPAAAAVAAILVWVREPPDRPATPVRRFPLRRAQLARLDRRYWLVVGFAAVLALARFSEAFLLLRATSVGLAATWVPVVLIVMNVAYAASAYPLGRVSDRRGRRVMIGLGVGLLIVADLILALAGSVWLVLAGAVVWGLHMGATQGLFSALVADRAPEDLRGTAFGVFNLVGGVGALLASVIAGVLWSAVGPAATFVAGAGFAAVCGLGLLGDGRGGAVRRDG